MGASEKSEAAWHGGHGWGDVDVAQAERVDAFVAGVREECDLYPGRKFVYVKDLRALLVRLEEEESH